MCPRCAPDVPCVPCAPDVPPMCPRCAPDVPSTCTRVCDHDVLLPPSPATNNARCHCARLQNLLAPVWGQPDNAKLEPSYGQWLRNSAEPPDRGPVPVASDQSLRNLGHQRGSHHPNLFLQQHAGTEFNAANGAMYSCPQEHVPASYTFLLHLAREERSVEALQLPPHDALHH